MRILVIIFLLLFCVRTYAAEESSSFSVTSGTFKDGNNIPKSGVFDGYGCTGNNLSPQLTWKNIPEGTKSFAITMYDPDAPTGSGWWHWGVFNIPVNISSIEEGASKTGKNKMPFGVYEMFTDFGNNGYGGPCPPEGDKPHRYIITVYALDVDRLDLSPYTTTGALLNFMLRNSTIAKATLTGYYGR